jgi:hypothetical protein
MTTLRPTTPPAPRLPNFFIAGAPKAGTTSLHFYLAQHPQVFMSPIKEPMFFGAADLLSPPYRDAVLARVARGRVALQAYLDGLRRPPTWSFVLDWDDYLRLFRDARGETAVGESSTGYLWLPSAAREIRSKVPQARLAFVLRDPAERALTMYSRDRWHDPRLTFPRWFQANRDQPRLRAGLGAARYGTHLQRFFEIFPREQLRVYLYEDYRADPRSVLRDLFAFLDVEPAYPVDVSRRHNETPAARFPRLHALRRRIFGAASPGRWLPPPARRALRRLYQRHGQSRTMDPADRQMVIAYYRDEIVRTAHLIGHDLSAWLR